MIKSVQTHLTGIMLTACGTVGCDLLPIGGTQYGTVASFQITAPYGTLQDTMEMLDRNKKIRLINSPSDPWEWDMYKREYRVKLDGKSYGYSDSLFFVFTHFRAGYDHDNVPIEIKTGRLPGQEVAEQAGKMSWDEKWKLKKAFEKSLLPLLAR